MSDSGRVYYFAKTHKKGKKIAFGIKEQDRFSHLLFVSKDTEKKRALFLNLFAQDVLNDKNIIYFASSSESLQELLRFVALHRAENSFIFDKDTNLFNSPSRILSSPKECENTTKAILQIFDEFKSDRASEILQASICTIFKNGLSLSSLPLFLKSLPLRKEFIKDNLQDFSEDLQAVLLSDEGLLPALSKRLEDFFKQKEIKEAFCNIDSDIGSGPYVFVINLQSFQNAKLARYFAQLQLAYILDLNLQNYFIFADELSDIDGEFFADFLDKAKQQNLSLNMENASIELIEPLTRLALFSNTQSILASNVSEQDAETLSDTLPSLNPHDILELKEKEIMLSLQIDGKKTKAFKAELLDAIDYPDYDYTDNILNLNKAIHCQEFDYKKYEKANKNNDIFESKNKNTDAKDLYKQKPIKKTHRKLKKQQYSPKDKLKVKKIDKSKRQKEFEQNLENLLSKLESNSKEEKSQHSNLKSHNLDIKDLGGTNDAHEKDLSNLNKDKKDKVAPRTEAAKERGMAENNGATKSERILKESEKELENLLKSIFGADSENQDAKNVENKKDG